MRKRAVGPVQYSEWVELLSQPLTDENAYRLKHGKLKDKQLSVTLFNRISDYVVDDYNSRVEAVKRAEFSDIIFALRKFSAHLSRMLFFKELDFIDEKHKQALIQSLKDATDGLVKALSEKFTTQDADLLYELNVLRRKSGVE